MNKEPQNFSSNLPFNSSVAEYQKCCDDIVREAKANPNVLSVYLLGGTWQPGISDLDIIVVYKNSAPTLRPPWSVSPEAKQIFTHRYLSFSPDDFKNFFYMYPKLTTRIRHLYGAVLEPVDPESIYTREDHKMLLACNLADVLINKLLISDLFFENKTALDVRRTIGELYSLTYTTTLVGAITGKTIGQNFPFDIQNFRLNWFKTGSAENFNKLESLMDRGRALIFEAVEELDSYLKKHQVETDVALRFVNKKYTVVFKENWNSEMFLTNLQKRRISFAIPFRNKKITNLHLVLPRSFSFFFLAYVNRSATSGDFSNLMRLGLGFGLGLGSAGGSGDEKQVKIPAPAARHAEVMNEGYRSLLKSNGLYRIPFMYGFSIFESKKPWLARLISVVIRLVRTMR